MTIITKLLTHAVTQLDALAYRFHGLGDDARSSVSYSVLQREVCRAAAQISDATRTGDRVLLLISPSLEYVISFLGAIAAGRVPVPAYPPRNTRHLSRLRSIANDCDAAVVLCDQQAATKLDLMKDTDGTLSLTGRRLLIEERPESGPELRDDAPGDRLAFLQYTSGSTGEPKGITITHENLDYNLRALGALFRSEQPQMGACWLPPYHDMGLIGGVLLPLYSGFPVHLMSPFSFLQDPARWLKIISNERVTISPSANFGFEYCNNKIPDSIAPSLHLSHWEFAIVGAEPVQERTMTRFCEKFAASGFRPSSIRPCYGLTECTMIVTGKNDTQALRSEAADTRINANEGAAPSVVSCGRPVEGHRIAVLSDEGKHCDDGQIGEVFISGPSVSMGYWRRDTLTVETFGQEVPDLEGRFLKTGDLGFLSKGELFVTGRIQEVLLLQGRRFFPHVVELIATTSHRALLGATAAAFTFQDNAASPMLAVVAEAEKRDGQALQEILQAVEAALSQRLKLDAGLIVLVRRGQVPRTTSGKTQRGRCKAMLFSGALAVLADSRHGRV